MFQPATSTLMPSHRIETLSPNVWAPEERILREEQLPFTVRLVRNDEDLQKAVQIRHSAYARHMPAVAETLKTPEKLDTADDVVVLLAESKLDGSPLGTARIQTNKLRPLGLEESVQLPDWLAGQTLAHISRLGIVQGHTGRLVKYMLFKGLFLYWEQNGIDWAVVAARPPLDRMYLQLLFEDMFPGQGFTPLPQMNNVPHRVMAFEVGTARERWTRANHPLTDFMCHTSHPDLDVSQAQDGACFPMDVRHPRLSSRASA